MPMAVISILIYTRSSLLWDSRSFTAASPGRLPCSLSGDSALLVSPGGRITSRPLEGTPRGVKFDVGFPSAPMFCRDSEEYAPVEVRVCHSILHILGHCQLVALLSESGEF